jgi:glycosyltransferase involved in cell wall biosynthesis
VSLPPSSQSRIGYLLTLFPKLSESFVLNEVVQLQRHGLEIKVISLDRSSRLETKSHAAARELAEPVTYVRDAFPRGHARAVAYWLRRDPAGLARLLVANQRQPTIRSQSRAGRLLMAAFAGWIARQRGVQHFHAHWSYPSDIALLLHRAWGWSFSFTAHAHDIFEDIPLYAAAGFSFAQRVEAAQFVVACTEYNREHLRALLPAVVWPKLYRAYHGLDLERFSPNYAGGQPPDLPILLSVGRFVPYKGFDTIVRACGRLREQGLAFECWLAGPEGSQTVPVREQIRAAGLVDAVRLLGPQTQEELAQLYRRATLFVNASNPHGEYGVANVIVEALSSGLPTIAADRPQVREYIQDGVNGLLVPHGDDAELANAIQRLLNDADLRGRLGGAGRDTARRLFDINATTSTLCSLLDSVGCR